MGNRLLSSLLGIATLSLVSMAQSSNQPSIRNHSKTNDHTNKIRSLTKDCQPLASIRHLLTGAIKRPQPEYPEAAKRKGITGAVDVLVYVNEEGKIYSAIVCKGHALLRQAALD